MAARTGLLSFFRKYFLKSYRFINTNVSGSPIIRNITGEPHLMIAKTVYFVILYGELTAVP